MLVLIVWRSSDDLFLFLDVLFFSLFFFSCLTCVWGGFGIMDINSYDWVANV